MQWSPAPVNLLTRSSKQDVTNHDRNSVIPGRAISATKTSRRDLGTGITYLTRALKAPTLRESAARLAARARAENSSHEE